ncbi:HNH endonuclease [Arthrobacter sedimenti]|uniref:HNH endonuclease n=1 Tax=Arthrobacter sedimenti TaxID=2694931 RepID=A0ABV8WH77_9MICC
MCDLAMDNDWSVLDKKDHRVVALSRLLNSSPLHPLDIRDEKYRNPAGVAFKMSNIITQHPNYAGKQTNGNKLDAIVLNEFLSAPEKMRAVASAIKAEIWSGGAAAPAEGDPDAYGEVAEGRLLLARHLKRERNQSLRNRKIQSVKNAGLPIACEVCSFNFHKVYGHRGHGYIEIHHILPLHASGPTTTRLTDLALLCANCHRMIHRGNPWLTPRELSTLINSKT